MPSSLPPLARYLGYAGLLPQLIILLLLASGSPEYRFTALSLGYAYAAVIFSFVGGLWWGLAAASGRAPAWVWVAAVAPSLIAVGSAIPWATGGDWPGPSLWLLGAALVASLLVDWRLERLGLTPRLWMALRSPLSIGLGAMTLAIAAIA